MAVRLFAISGIATTGGDEPFSLFFYFFSRAGRVFAISGNVELGAYGRGAGG